MKTTLHIEFERETAEAFVIIPTIAVDKFRGRFTLWFLAGRKSLSVNIVKE